jgi:hypothetical protein
MAKKSKKLTKAKKFVISLQKKNKLFWARTGSSLLISFPCGPNEVIKAAERYSADMFVKLREEPNWCQIFIGTCERDELLTDKFYERIYFAIQAILDIRRTEKQGTCNRYRSMIRDEAKNIADLEQNLHNNKHSLERELREGEELIKSIDFKLLEKYAEEKNT